MGPSEKFHSLCTKEMGHSRKDPYLPPPHGGNKQYPSPVQTSYTNLRHSLDNCPPWMVDFLCGWGMDHFWNDVIENSPAPFL